MMASPYEKMYLIDESEYMKLKRFDYPQEAYNDEPQTHSTPAAPRHQNVSQPQTRQHIQFEEQELAPEFQQLARTPESPTQQHSVQLQDEPQPLLNFTFDIPTSVDLANNSEFLNETINVAAHELVEATNLANQYTLQLEETFDAIEALCIEAGIKSPTKEEEEPRYNVVTFEEHQWNNLSYEEYQEAMEIYSKMRAQMDTQDQDDPNVIEYFTILNMLYQHTFYPRYANEKARVNHDRLAQLQGTAQEQPMAQAIEM